MQKAAAAEQIQPAASESRLGSDRYDCCISTLSLFPSCTEPLTKHSGKTPHAGTMQHSEEQTWLSQMILFYFFNERRKKYLLI